MFRLAFHLNCHQSGWKKFPGNSSKSPEVPFYGITSPCSYFEVILIFAPIQQEAKPDQEKQSDEKKSLLTKHSNVLPFYSSSQNSNLL